jgi:hypothetical protein
VFLNFLLIEALDPALIAAVDIAARCRFITALSIHRGGLRTQRLLHAKQEPSSAELSLELAFASKCVFHKRVIVLTIAFIGQEQTSRLVFIIRLESEWNISFS